MNWLAWDGERHIPFDYGLFKICVLLMGLIILGRRGLMRMLGLRKLCG